jgi:hypothetical protein
VDRREFLAGSLIPATGLAAHPTQTGATRDAATVRIATSAMRLEFDPARGRCSLYHGDRPLILNATCSVGFPRAEALASDPNYAHQVRTDASSLPGLAGPQFVIDSKDCTGKLDLEWRIGLLNDAPGAVFEVRFTNTGSKDLLIRNAEPMRARADERAGCFFSVPDHYARAWKVLTNGYMYYDPGDLVNLQSIGQHTFESFWNAAFYMPETRQTMVAGYVDNREAEGRILIDYNVQAAWDHGKAVIGLAARSLYNVECVLRPGATFSSGKVLLLVSDDPFLALETYAERTARLHDVRLNPIVNGWCSWAFTGRHSTEGEQLRNAEFIARHLKPYGMDTVQVDDGWQRTWGEWEGDERYPHGMKWLAAKLNDLGLKAGIWLAPCVVGEGTDIARNHQDWLVRDVEGNLQTLASGDGKYILDITHPGALRWLRELFRTVAHDWGYEFIKLDYVEWSLLAASRYYDPTFSKARAYRLLLSTIREAAGPNCHILDCGPSQISIGLIDSVRIELDHANDWQQYAKDENSAVPAVAKRYYFNDRTWINDADHVLLQRMTLPQGQAAASLIALSGGTTISGDQLVELDEARLDTLRRILPAWGRAARPLDLFEKQSPEIFALKVEGGFEDWQVLAYFNWDEQAHASRDFDLARLGLNGAKRYLLRDFWSEEWLGPAHPGVPIRIDIPPSSVRLLAVREMKDVPQLLGTSRHFTQGAVELKDVRWDAQARRLSGRALGAPQTRWDMFVHVPAGWVPDRKGRVEFSIAGLSADPNYAVTATGPRTLRVRFAFDGTGAIEWSLPFRAD